MKDANGGNARLFIVGCDLATGRVQLGFPPNLAVNLSIEDRNIPREDEGLWKMATFEGYRDEYICN